MKTKILINVLSIMVLVVALSGVVMAQTAGSISDLGITKVTVGGSEASVTGLVGVIEEIVKWVYTIFFIIAVLMILVAAFTYLTAQGDSEKIGAAKTQIIYAAVAIVVALLAVSFQTIIATFLKGGA